MNHSIRRLIAFAKYIRAPKRPGWKLVFKGTFTAAALFFVCSQIDLKVIQDLILQIPVPLTLAAIVVFNLSKIVGSVRLCYVFRAGSIRLTQSENLRLYYKGMFYSLFLPGSVGGDGYKMFFLTNATGASWRKVFFPILWDRISGVFALLLLSSILLLFYPFDSHLTDIRVITCACIVAAAFIFQLATRVFFQDFSPIVLSSSLLAILVQVLQGSMAMFIFYGMQVPLDNMLDYIILFFLSSLATIVPITIGGLGARESVFIFSAQYASVDPQKALAFSLIFYLISSISALLGGVIGDDRRVIVQGEA